MKKTSKIISIFMAVVLSLSIFAVSASAVATPLNAGSSKAAATNIPSYGTEYVSELSKGSETDWFKFTTLPDDAYYNVSFKLYSLPTGSGYDFATNFVLYDEYLQKLGEGYNNSNFNLKLDPNSTYYMKVFNGEFHLSYTGTYEIKVSYAYDVDENNKAEATKINLNQTYVRSLDGFDDEDWFKFTATSTENYKINFTLSSLPTGTSTGFATNCTIYDEHLQTLATNYNSRTFTLNLEAGNTYYIRVFNSDVHDCTGTYKIEVLNSSPTTKSLSKITIDSMPTKTTYTVGESFDKTGMVVKAHYSDGTTAKITSYSLSGFDSENAGTKTIKVSYTANGVTKSCTFNVTVEEKEQTDDDSSDDNGYASSGLFIIDFFIVIWMAITNFFGFLFGGF